MKKFKFKFNGLVWGLLALCILASIGGLIWNVITLIDAIKRADKIVVNGLITGFNALLALLVISVTTYSRYVVKDGKLYTRFGIIFNKVDLKKIVQFTHFKKSNKLVAYFKSAEYTVIVISPEEFEDFILTVRKINPEIIYDSKIEGEDTPN